MSKTILIIGGGPAGCAAAHQLTLAGYKNITLIEQGPYLGAGARTFFHGGHPYTFGPRHLIAKSEEVFNYINSFCPMHRCSEHEFWSYVEQDQQFYNFPIHVDDIKRMPEKDKISKELYFEGYDYPPSNLEEYWRNSVGTTLYEKFIKKYSKKMWGVEATELDTFSWSPKGVALKSGPRAAWDTAISAYPIAHDGYNRYFDIATQDVKVHLSTKIQVFDFTNKLVWIDGTKYSYDIIISTISPDIPFDQMHGALPYIGRNFYKIILPIKFALPPNVYWIYEVGEEKWTRTTEFKKLTKYESDQTLLGVEVPSKNGQHYPLPIKKYQRQAQQYFDLMPNGVFSMGRNGSYRYSIDIGSCIEQSFELIDVLKQGGQDHPVIGEKWRRI